MTEHDTWGGGNTLYTPTTSYSVPVNTINQPAPSYHGRLVAAVAPLALLSVEATGLGGEERREYQVALLRRVRHFPLLRVQRLTPHVRSYQICVNLVLGAPVHVLVSGCRCLLFGLLLLGQ